MCRTSTPRVVDLGCGRGADFIRFERRFPGVNYTGIDMSENMLSQGPFRHHDRVRLICQSIETASLPTADIIWSFMGMQNACSTRSKLKTFLGRINDCLETDGIFLGAFPNGTRILRDMHHLDDHKQLYRFCPIPAPNRQEKWYSFTLKDAYENLQEAAISPAEVFDCAKTLGFEVQALSFAEYIRSCASSSDKSELFSKIVGDAEVPAWAMRLAEYYTCFVIRKRTVT